MRRLGFRAAILIALSICLPLCAQEHRRIRPRESQGSSEPASRPEFLQTIEVPGYRIYSQLPPGELRSVLHRIEKMRQEYARRTAELSNETDDRRLPFCLFKNADDYARAGGPRGSAGAYNGERLLALIPGRPDARTWHVIQHEAFHQFLISKLGAEMPIWMNEGLAEYFGEAMYTGDGFVTGLVPAYRLRRLQGTLDRTEFSELLSMSHREWNAGLSQVNYDMAWALVHFLAHAENGSHQKQLTEFIRGSAQGKDGVKYFERTVGPLGMVQRQFIAYWKNYSPVQVRDGYAQVAVQTLCSFGIRRSLAGKPMASAKAFEDYAANATENDEDELPLSVLRDCLAWNALKLGSWHFDYSARARANVWLDSRDGETWSARATVENGTITRVESWSGR